MMMDDNLPLKIITAFGIKPGDNPPVHSQRRAGQYMKRGPGYVEDEGRISGESSPAYEILVELLVDTRGDDRKLVMFKKHLDAAVHSEAESFGGILRETRLTEDITSILVMLEPGQTEKLRSRLSAIPGVRVIEDNPGFTIKMSEVDLFPGGKTIMDNLRPFNCIRLVCE
jgi:hypothetical protein